MTVVDGLWRVLIPDVFSYLGMLSRHSWWYFVYINTSQTMLITFYCDIVMTKKHAPPNSLALIYITVMRNYFCIISIFSSIHTSWWYLLCCLKKSMLNKHTLISTCILSFSEFYCLHTVCADIWSSLCFVHLELVSDDAVWCYWAVFWWRSLTSTFYFSVRWYNMLYLFWVLPHRIVIILYALYIKLHIRYVWKFASWF